MVKERHKKHQKKVNKPPPKTKKTQKPKKKKKKKKKTEVKEGNSTAQEQVDEEKARGAHAPLCGGGEEVEVFKHGHLFRCDVRDGLELQFLQLHVIGAPSERASEGGGEGGGGRRPRRTRIEGKKEKEEEE